MSELQISDDWKKIPGWSGDDVERLYRRAVAEAVDGDTLVEVGVCYGRSFALLGELAIASKKRLRVVGVDSWGGETNSCDYGRKDFPDLEKAAGGFYEACQLMLHAHAPNVLLNCHLWRMPSSQGAEKMTKAGWAPAFVFIDADHSEEGVRADLEFWAWRMRLGGRVAGHDWGGTFPGVERAVRAFVAPRGVNVEVDGSVWSVTGVTGK